MQGFKNKLYIKIDENTSPNYLVNRSFKDKSFFGTTHIIYSLNLEFCRLLYLSLHHNKFFNINLIKNYKLRLETVVTLTKEDKIIDNFVKNENLNQDHFVKRYEIFDYKPNKIKLLMQPLYNDLTQKVQFNLVKKKREVKHFFVNELLINPEEHLPHNNSLIDVLNNDFKTITFVYPWELELKE